MAVSMNKQTQHPGHDLEETLYLDRLERWSWNGHNIKDLENKISEIIHFDLKDKQAAYKLTVPSEMQGMRFSRDANKVGWFEVLAVDKNGIALVNFGEECLHSGDGYCHNQTMPMALAEQELKSYCYDSFDQACGRSMSDAIKPRL